MRSNDPGRVNRGKGYRAVNWLDYSVAIWDVNGVHLGLGYNCSQQPPLLALRLILVVNRAAQYVVYGGSRFRRGGLSSTGRFLNISPEVINLSTKHFRLQHRLVSCL